MAGADPDTTVASESTGKQGKRWLPLESNPDVLNDYCEKLGWPTALMKWTDVLSTEDWALEMVPQPVKAVTLLFPIKEKTEEFRKEEAERIKEKGQDLPKEHFFTKQTVGNACGTVAVFHAVGNASSAFGGDIELPEGSYFRRFFDSAVGKTSDELADMMEADDELEVSHSATATAEGNATEADMDVETHFIAFVVKDGKLLELDGRKETPIVHGESSDATLLADAAKIIQGFMERDPGEMRFSVLALAPAMD